MGPCHNGMARLQSHMEHTVSRTAEKGWTSNLVVVWGAKISSLYKE